MKDSGVKWIGELPNNWKVEPIGKLFKERNTKVSDRDFPPLSVTKNGIVPQLENAAKSKNHNDRKQVSSGDFVINSRSDRKMSSGLSALDGSVSLINIVLTSEHLFPDYTKYLLKNYGFAEEFYRWGTGIVADLWSTRYERMKRILVPYPSTEEQQKIAAFLDEKVAHIDNIIEDTKQSIENLKAYKHSLINETVTKGLNPDVEMKDSGIEWVGEIPNNWEISKVKYFFNIRLGKQLQPQKKNNEDSLKPYLRAANVSWSGIDTSDIKKMWFSKKETEIYKLEYGDLIVSEGGDAGRAAIYKGELPECYVQNAVHRVRGENTYLLYYWLFAAKSVGFVDILCNKATFMHFTVDKFREFPYLRIPEGEQKEIINFLDNKSFEIDTTVYQKEQLITELESYKKSLIYEYVTGKKEVK